MRELVGARRARIAIDVIPLLGPLTGVGHYIHQLVRHFGRLSPHYEYVYYYGYFTKRLLKGNKGIHAIKDFVSRLPLLKAGLRGIRGTGARFHPGEFDLYFEPNFIPLGIKAKNIVTTVHDFSVQLFPEAHPKERVRYFTKAFIKNVRRSTHVITDSLFIKTEAINLLNLPAEMITPVHLGVDHDVFKIYEREGLEFCRREFGLPENFILFVGTREPRKNLDRLVEAYAELPQQLRSEFGLVLVGPQGWGAGDRLVREKLGDRITILNYLETHKLAQVYNLASVFVYPSLYEGFGLPPLEGMACGCPVIASRAASLPEVCGDAAYYVDPEDVQSIAGGIQKMLTDDRVRQDLVKKGLERSKGFSWERTAQETLRVFSEALSDTPGKKR
jgi:glycosyltransferase involved in cell wall biosynthesis